MASGRPMSWKISVRIFAEIFYVISGNFGRLKNSYQYTVSAVIKTYRTGLHWQIKEKYSIRSNQTVTHKFTPTVGLLRSYCDDHQGNYNQIKSNPIYLNQATWPIHTDSQRHKVKE